MAITFSTAVRSVMCDAIVDLLDAGSPPGNMQVGTTGFASILATIALSNPAFGSAASGVATLSGTPLQDTSADNTGTAAVWRMRNAAGTAILSGTTSTSGNTGDITYDVTAQAAALNAVNTFIGTSGKVQFTTAGDTGFAAVVATLTLNSSAFATTSTGALTLNTSPAPTVSSPNAGTVTLFRFTKSDGTSEAFRGSVGTSGTDIVFVSNVFGVGANITLSTFPLTLPSTSAASDGTLITSSLSIVSGETFEVTSGSFSSPA